MGEDERRDMQITQMPLSALKEYGGNAKLHDEANVEAIRASIRRFGNCDPIGVWTNPQGEVEIVEGHGRKLALTAEGYEVADVIFLDHLTDEERRAYALAHNQTTLMTDFDLEVLEEELDCLAGFGMEDFGFEIGDDDEPVEVVEDEVPEDAPPRCKLGDVWQLGECRLMCGDSTDTECVEALMDGAKADMAFTDPPYGVEYTGGIQFKNTGVVKNGRKMIIGDDSNIYDDVFQTLSQHVDGACYVWFAGTRGGDVYRAAEKHGVIHAVIVWVKNGGYGALNANYKQKHELCLYWNAKNTKLKFIGKTTENTVWEISKDGVNEFHPTQKPVSLAAKAVQNHKANSVLDLFGGSGSTLIACEQLGRKCYMMELDPHYCDVIIKRWEDLTGKEAVLLAG